MTNPELSYKPYTVIEDKITITGIYELQYRDRDAVEDAEEEEIDIEFKYCIDGIDINVLMHCFTKDYIEYTKIWNEEEGTYLENPADSIITRIFNHICEKHKDLPGMHAHNKNYMYFFFDRNRSPYLKEQ